MRRTRPKLQSKELISLRLISSEFLKLFFLGNSYLLRVVGRTMLQQCNEIESSGFSCSYKTMQQIRGGFNLFSSTMYLAIIAHYWGLSILDVVLVGKEQQDKVKEGEFSANAQKSAR